MCLLAHSFFVCWCIIYFWICGRGNEREKSEASLKRYIRDAATNTIKHTDSLDLVTGTNGHKYFFNNVCTHIFTSKMCIRQGWEVLRYTNSFKNTQNKSKIMICLHLTDTKTQIPMCIKIRLYRLTINKIYFRKL